MLTRAERRGLAAIGKHRRSIFAAFNTLFNLQTRKVSFFSPLIFQFSLVYDSRNNFQFLHRLFVFNSLFLSGLARLFSEIFRGDNFMSSYVPLTKAGREREAM
jgi:hypothetical protein